MSIGTFLVALLLILAGAALFLANLGYVSMFLIRRLANFWPLIFILIGLSLFWGGRIPRLLAFVIVIILVGGLILLVFTGGLFRYFPYSI
ncbi:MAG TPA: hypothetical protein GX004_04015 [Firmicutes bacterium]|nr:hypothetical protein [Bacillota bacterium]